MTSRIARRAVVLGGSLAGILAARVLSESYGQVLVVDRDAVVGVDRPRRGAPHTIHAHALHARGQQILEALFPGLTNGLIASGVPSCDYGDMHWFIDGTRLRSERIGLLSVMAPRPKLEAHIRARVVAAPNVRFLERYETLGIVASADRKRITGARIRPTDAPNDVSVLDADLVVDATGRGSRTPVWLEELGYDRPEEERMTIGLAYTTRHYKTYPGMLDGIPSINSIATPNNLRGAFFGKIGPNLCNLSLTGMLGDHAPTDPDGFLEFVRSLPVPQIYETVRHAEPLMDPVRFNYPASRRRHYVKLDRFPEHFLPIGDAVCSFDPVYGQGMTVAAMEADALLRYLSAGAAPDPAEFFTDIDEILRSPWEISAGGDLAFPGVEGRRTAESEQANQYLARLQLAMTKDAQVTGAFMRVTGLIDPPAALLEPSLMARIQAASGAPEEVTNRSAA